MVGLINAFDYLHSPIDRILKEEDYKLEIELGSKYRKVGLIFRGRMLERGIFLRKSSPIF